MGMKKSNKSKIEFKPPKWQICTEGVTEANYLREYIKAKGLTEHIIINCSKNKAIARGCGKQHEALLNKMQECGRERNPERTFLVHDYDNAVDQPNEKESFNNTFKRVEELDYYIIYSNPCFEYWLMLHKSYSDSDLHRDDYQNKVKEICNQKLKCLGKPAIHDDGYKSDPNLFEYFGGLEGSKVARHNAKRRFDKAEGPFATAKHAKNTPCTNFFELLDAIDEYYNKYNT